MHCVQHQALSASDVGCFVANEQASTVGGAVFVKQCQG